MFRADWLLAAAFVAACLLFGVGVSNPEIPRWAALHVFAALALLVCWRGFDLPKGALWGVGLFAWAGLSLLWSVDWRGGAVELANGLALLAVFLVAACGDRERIERLARCWSPAIVLGAAVLCFAFPQWLGGFGNENFLVEFFAVALPFLILARGRLVIVPAVLAAVAGLWFIGSTPSNLKWLLLASIGLVALVYVYRAGFRWAALILGTGAVVLGLASGVIGPDMMGSVAARFEIAFNSLAMWLDAPLWGHGLGSFNVVYPNYQERHLNVFPTMGTVFGADMSYYAGAAHNEYAQVLADYGLIGFFLAGGLVWSLIGKIRDRLYLAAALSLFVAAVLSLVEFPLQNPQTGIVAAFAAGICLNGTKSIKVPRFAGLIAVPAVAVMGVVAVLTFQSWKLFSVTEYVAGRDPYSGLLANFAAYQTFSWPRQFRNQLAVSLNSAISKEPDTIRIEADAADAVYHIARGASGRATVIELGRIEYLLMAGRWHERLDEIEERLSWLRQNASRHAAVWLVEGKWALALGDKDRARQAATVAQTLPSYLLGYQDYIKTIMAATE